MLFVGPTLLKVLEAIVLWDTWFAYAHKYPIPPMQKPHRRSPLKLEDNLRTKPQNIVKTSQGKSAARYTFAAPRTRTKRPPWLSFKFELTRSAELRSLYRTA